MSQAANPEVQGKLARMGCAPLVDAMRRVHSHRAHMLALTSPTPDRPLFGPAATIAFMPYRDDLPESKTDFASHFYRAVGKHPAGRVLVLSSGGHPQVSHGGGTKLSRLANHGMSGVLTDGRLRDFDQLRESGIAAWCSGEATRWGGDTIMPYAADITVEVGGVCVTPGDFIYADASGAVVIPAHSLSRVLDEAAAIDAEDARFTQTIRDEKLPS
ncbi:RraA family protein [Streptomyces sp. NPDC005480]|uniref:RraA family protein n=1 Tax=Streptomyces sp. NPDC005480 TaxID=3154880 RepID=UPI0033B099D4